MQRNLAPALLIVTLLSAGCLGIPEAGPGSAEEAFVDDLDPRFPVHIEELGPDHRRYTWDLSAFGPAGGRLYRYVILPLDAVQVDVRWNASFDAFAVEDECSVVSADVGVLGVTDDTHPSVGSIHWTDTRRTRSEAAAGAGLIVGEGRPGPAPRETHEAERQWTLGPKEELGISFGSSRGSEHWAIRHEPRQHDLNVSVEVHGPSIVISRTDPGADQGWFDCGAGIDNIRRPTARAGIGPVYTTYGATTGWTTITGASLVWHNPGSLPVGQHVTVRFLDETHQDPASLVRTSAAGGEIAFSFDEWTEEDDAKPHWLLAGARFPWLDHGTHDGQVLHGAAEAAS